MGQGEESCECTVYTLFLDSYEIEPSKSNVVSVHTHHGQNKQSQLPPFQPNHGQGPGYQAREVLHPDHSRVIWLLME